MKLLNLSYPNKSDIIYKISSYPDGQQSIKIENPFINDSDVKIYSRMNSFKDIELIICANQALIEMGVKNIELFVPYFLGARSDRKFSDGTSNYLKTVICPIINTQNFKSVTVLDPHSDVLEACLNNFKKLDNHDLVKYALTDIDNRNDARERLYLVSPDAGALKKIYGVAEKFDITNVIVASKHRDIKTGKIVSTEVPGLPTSGGPRNFVIVDDICDGGRTFTELAKVIRETRLGDKIYLVVTHGIFSAGFEELSKYFDGIYCTNSIKDIEPSQATLVKQINVF